MIRDNAVQDIKVIREGKLMYDKYNSDQNVKAHELVVGDVYIVEAGMMIPADSILIECSEQP